jgi:hypothetical protein
MTLQDFIHKFTEGSGSRALKLAMVFFAMVGLGVWYDAAAFKNLSTIEGMDAAQLARNLGEGRGFTTEFVRPLSLHLLKGRRAANEPVLTDQHPDLANAPLYPVLLALALKVMPFPYPDLAAVKDFSVYTPDLCIAIFNQVLFFVAVWMVWRLARRLFDEPVAWVSAGAFAGSDLFWRFSVSGQSTLLLIVIVLGVVEVLARMEPETREGATRSEGWLLRMAAFAGLLVGLAGMTRYSFGWLIAPVALFLGSLPTPRKAGMMACAVATFVLVMAPWVIRNVALAGTPFGTAGYAVLQNTGLYSEHQLERTLNPDFSLMDGAMIWHKLLTGLREILEKELPRLGGSWVSAFFLVGLMVPFRNPTLRRLRSFLLGSLGTLLVVQALGRTGLSAESPEVNSENLLVVLAPVVLMLGVSLFFMLLEQFGMKMPAFRLFAVGAFTLVAAAPLLFSLMMPSRSALSYPPYYPPDIQEKARWMEPQDLIMADFPWAVAWYGHRQCVWLSLSHREAAGQKFHNDFYELNKQGKPIGALYLSARTLRTMEMRPIMDWVRRDARGEDWEPYVGDWESFVLVGVYLFREIPSGFPLKQAPFGVVGELFLAQTERSARKPIKAE